MLHEKNLTQLSALLKAKKISSVELTKQFLDRIHRLDNQFNSFITICEDEALTQAKAADKRIQTGTANPLTGIPVAQKDIFCTKDILTTCGSKMLHNFISPYNATVVENFNQTGSVLLGKKHVKHVYVVPKSLNCLIC